MNNVLLRALLILALFIQPTLAQNSNPNNQNYMYGRQGYYGNAPRPYGYPAAGMMPYQNQPGFGYYSPNPYASGYPAYGVPVPMNNGNVRFNIGGFGGSYWRSPSGFYYPWGAGYGATTIAPPVIVVQQGQSAPAQPSISEMLKDMDTYIQEQNKNGKFNVDDYAHLNRRLNDLKTKQSSFAIRNGGSLDSIDEESLRKDLSMLSGDIARRVKP